MIDFQKTKNIYWVADKGWNPTETAVWSNWREKAMNIDTQRFIGICTSTYNTG